MTDDTLSPSTLGEIRMTEKERAMPRLLFC